MSNAFPPDLAAFVQSEIALGKYPSEDALMIAAVRLLREQEEEDAALRQDIQAAIDQMERGECTRYDARSAGTLVEEIKSEGRRLLAARQNSGHE
jgi:putative addiction module CopG family antidote